MADDNEVRITISANDQASRVIEGVYKGVEMIADGIKDLTGDYASFGDEVRKLSSYTGMTTEEASRLKEVAEAGNISYSTLVNAAKAMTMENTSNAKEAKKLNDEIDALTKKIADSPKPTAEMTAKLADLQQQLKDVAPAANLSVESLAKLSDQYLQLKDPVQQSEFLMTNFKRSGVDLARVMELGGDAIRKYAADTASGNIITAERAKRIEEVRLKQVEFNNAEEALKNDAADRLFQIFEGMPKPLQDTVLGLNAIISANVIGGLTQVGILVNTFRIASAGAAGTTLAAAGAADVATVSFGQMAIATAAAFAPFALLTGALATLYEVITHLKEISEWGKQFEASQPVLYHVLFGALGKPMDIKTNIGEESAPETTAQQTTPAGTIGRVAAGNTASMLGGGTIMLPANSNGAATQNFVINVPGGILGTPEQLAAALMPTFRLIQRQTGGR